MAARRPRVNCDNSGDKRHDNSSKNPVLRSRKRREDEHDYRHEGRMIHLRKRRSRVLVRRRPHGRSRRLRSHHLVCRRREGALQSREMNKRGNLGQKRGLVSG